MARDINTIKLEILAQAQLSGNLAPLFAMTSSATAIFNEWAYDTAVSINTFEQLVDILIAQAQDIADNNVLATGFWWQQKLLQFQYDATIAQVLEVVNFTPQYPVVDATKQLITNATIKINDQNVVVMRVATTSGGVIVPITTQLPEINAYVSQLQPSGIATEIVSQNPDLGWVTADVYYNGLYPPATLKTAVITAITNYLQSVTSPKSLDGVVLKEDLINAIKSVPGVVTVDMEGLSGITSLQNSFQAIEDGGTYSGDVGFRYDTAAGYIIVDSGKPLSTYINMVLYS